MYMLSKPPDPPDRPSSSTSFRPPPPPPASHPPSSNQAPPSKSNPPLFTYPTKKEDPLENSIYFENFPEFKNESEFKSLLKGLLPIKEIRLIQKNNKAGKKFGFLKCAQDTNIQSAINILNGIWIGKFKISANKAKFNMISKRESYQNCPPTKPFTSRIPTSATRSRDIRTYAEVMKGEKSTHLEKISMIYDTNSGTPKWLERSCLGVLRSLELIPNIHQIVSSRYPGSEVRVLGGNLILTTFPHLALKENSFKEENAQWTAKFFELWREWDKHDVAQGRFTWLKISRVPLHVWNTDFFKALVCGYGDYILESKETESKSRFDIAKILINTSRSERIHDLIKVQIDGETFQISIIEDGIQELLFDYRSPTDSESIPDRPINNRPIVPQRASYSSAQMPSFSHRPDAASGPLAHPRCQSYPAAAVFPDHAPPEIEISPAKKQIQSWRPLAGRNLASIGVPSPLSSIASSVNAVANTPSVVIANSAANLVAVDVAPILAGKSVANSDKHTDFSKSVEIVDSFSPSKDKSTAPESQSATLIFSKPVKSIFSKMAVDFSKVSRLPMNCNNNAGLLIEKEGLSSTFCRLSRSMSCPNLKLKVPSPIKPAHMNHEPSAGAGPSKVQSFLHLSNTTRDHQNIKISGPSSHVCPPRDQQSTLDQLDNSSSHNHFSKILNPAGDAAANQDFSPSQSVSINHAPSADKQERGTREKQQKVIESGPLNFKMPLGPIDVNTAIGPFRIKNPKKKYGSISKIMEIDAARSLANKS